MNEPATQGNQKNSIINKLIVGVESLVDLKIVTCVGEISFTVEDGKVKLDQSNNFIGIRTKINLFSGDIENLIHSDFVNTNADIMNFHNEQVELGRKIIESNVKTTVELAKLAGESISELLNQDSSRDSSV